MAEQDSFNNTAIQYFIDNFGYQDIHCLNHIENSDEVWHYFRDKVKQRIEKGKKYQENIPIEDDDEGYGERDFAKEASEEILDFMIYLASLMLRLDKYRDEMGNFYVEHDEKHVDIDKIRQEYLILETLMKQGVSMWVKMAQLYKARLI